MKRLVLIDGNAILHRAYHALPPLTSPDGSLVNAVYGFTAMMIKIAHDLSPTQIVVAFDRPAPTFRKKLFKAYQAKRPKMDEELAGQIDTVHRVIEALGIPICEVDGYEADDVIGTLVGRRKQEGMDQVIIVTGDKDLLQLVDEHTWVYMPTKGLSEAKLYDAKDVKDKLGVNPQNVTDFKALAGDNSDNYPGVPGIGPKTAAELVAQFGSIETLFRAINRKDKKITLFSAGTLQKLKAGKKSAVLSKDLATIRCDVPVEVVFPEKEVFSLDTPEARKILAELNFQSLIKRLDAKNSQPEKKKKKKETEQENKENSQQQQLF